MARYKGARNHAWRYLSMLWTVGLTLGALGYFKHFFMTMQTLPSLHTTEGKYLLGFSAFITMFLSISYVWAADRHGRPLSLVSLVVYPIFSALGDGFLLLFIFDVGRWLRALAAGEPLSWQQFNVGGSALADKGLEDPLFYRDFMWGFAPYTISHAALYSLLLEPLVLPDHLVLDAPNAFMKAIIVAQFSYIAIYYATGDVFAYCFMRWVAELLTVVAVRMPPPGSQAPGPRKAKTS